MDDQDDQRHKPEPPDPIDFSKWDQNSRQIIEHLRDLLIQRDPVRLEEHRRFLPTIPDGLGDAEHLGHPAHYGLLAYGGAGLAALYQSAIEDEFEAAFWSGRVCFQRLSRTLRIPKKGYS